MIHYRVIYWKEVYRGARIGAAYYNTWEEANRVACRYNQQFCYLNGYFKVSGVGPKGYML
jgi:hypothetical protein